MKKYFIFAAAALVALAACSKVEKDEVPAGKITFKAVNYVAQTKAGEVSVLNDFTAFKCKAFLHAEGIDLNADGAVNGTSFQNFFGADGETVSVDNASAPTEWAPSHTYYWPKGEKSFVNFVGWYGKDGTGAESTPTITYAYANSKYKATLVWNYTSVAGNSASNLLYSDMAWRFKQNNNPATYTSVSKVSEGVPMLFHHALAQINVKVYAEGTPALTAGSGTVSDANATWTIALESPSITTVYNAGTLTLTNEDPGTAATPQAWTGSWAGTGETGNITAANLNVDKVTKETANTLFNATCVVPQTIGASVVLNFNMHITTTYKANPANPNEELIPVSIKLNDMGTSAWAQNTKYTYYIKINPSQSKVLFDPALEADWTEATGLVDQTI